MLENTFCRACLGVGVPLGAVFVFLLGLYVVMEDSKEFTRDLNAEEIIQQVQLAASGLHGPLQGTENEVVDCLYGRAEHLLSAGVGVSRRSIKSDTSSCSLEIQSGVRQVEAEKLRGLLGKSPTN